jgi:hypothetical protein
VRNEAARLRDCEPRAGSSTGNGAGLPLSPPDRSGPLKVECRRQPAPRGFPLSARPGPSLAHGEPPCGRRRVNAGAVKSARTSHASAGVLPSVTSRSATKAWRDLTTDWQERARRPTVGLL